MGGIMKNMTRLSLALIMFSVFSVSYLVTSVSAQPPMGQHKGMAPGTGMGMGQHQGMAPGTGMGMGQHQGMPATGVPYTGTPGGYAPGTAPMGAPGMMAPGTGMGQRYAPGTNPGPAGAASGSSYTGLREPGTGPHDGPGDALSHCDNFSGAPKAACIAAASNKGAADGDNSHCAKFAAGPRAACEAAAAGR
jgi:hypothetical protein